MTRRALLAAILIALTVTACTVSEVQYVSGLALTIIDYKLSGGGWR